MNPVTNAKHIQELKARLQPLEVMQPSVRADGSYDAVPVSVGSVHMCRWNSPRDPASGNLSDPGEFPTDDPDRIVFKLSLPAESGQGPLTIHVSTDGARDTPGGSDSAALYNDPGADVQLFEAVPGSGVFESKPIVVVADTDDDKWAGGRAVDGALNDPTFIGWPGGKLQIMVPALNNAVVQFPIKEFSHSFDCYFIQAGALAGDIVSATAINENIWRLQEIYAPLHERVVMPAEDTTLISQADLQSIVGPDNQMSDIEAKALVAKIDTLGLPITALKVVFVCKPFERVSSAGIVGGENQMYADGRGDIVMCFLATIAPNGGVDKPFTWAVKFSSTAAHECGHSLRGTGHTETAGVYTPTLINDTTSPLLPTWHLMCQGTNNKFIDPRFPVQNGKHWFLRDEEIVHKADGNKYSKKIP